MFTHTVRIPVWMGIADHQPNRVAVVKLLRLIMQNTVKRVYQAFIR